MTEAWDALVNHAQHRAAAFNVWGLDDAILQGQAEIERLRAVVERLRAVVQELEDMTSDADSRANEMARSLHEARRELAELKVTATTATEIVRGLMSKGCPTDYDGYGHHCLYCGELVWPTAYIAIHRLGCECDNAVAFLGEHPTAPANPQSPAITD